MRSREYYRRLRSILIRRIAACVRERFVSRVRSRSERQGHEENRRPPRASPRHRRHRRGL
ncbi:MAG: hypothetical protein MZU84_06180 [Sphingobacterium sp.]|nr:hypothetical protein [Sphingobacterium sp.]